MARAAAESPAVGVLDALEPSYGSRKWIPAPALGQAIKNAFAKGYGAEFIERKLREADPDLKVPTCKVILAWLRDEGIDTTVKPARRAQQWREANS